MFNLVARQELAESAFRFPILVRFVGKKLRTVIGDYLSDLPNLAVIFKRFSYKLDAVFGSCSMKFSASKYKPGAIVKNNADLRDCPGPSITAHDCGI